jgi:hypothetical protein
MIIRGLENAQDSFGGASANISPTSWILTSGYGIVRDYSVDAVDIKTPLSIAFLSADSSESGGREFDRAIEGVERCLRLWRPDDRWAILKLKPASVVLNGTVLHLKDTTSPGARSLVESPARFSVSFRDIEGMLAAEAVKVPGTAAEAIRTGCHEVLISPPNSLVTRDT